MFDGKPCNGCIDQWSALEEVAHGGKVDGRYLCVPIRGEAEVFFTKQLLKYDYAPYQFRTRKFLFIGFHRNAASSYIRSAYLIYTVYAIFHNKHGSDQVSIGQRAPRALI